MFNSPLTFKEAAEAVASRADTPTALNYRDIMRTWAQDARQRAFFSARVADATILSELHRRVSQVVNGEMTKRQAVRLLRESFIGEKADALAAMGFAPRVDARGVSNLASSPRLALILETNVRMAQERGHYQQWERVADAFPYGVWHCGYAEQHRPGHLARDGKCYPFDHPIWTQSPPGGEFNCHCWREVVTREGAERRGLVPEPLDSPFEPSSLGFDPSRPLDGGTVQPGKRVLPELADKARQEPPQEVIQNILPENPPEPQPVAMLQETDEQHAARRQAQWQAAYEKRRDDWKAQCEKSIPVAPGHQDYAEYKKTVDTIIAQYTPDAAKLGKPPKLDFYNGKDAYYSNKDNTMRLGGFIPNEVWYHCEGCIRHEWGHWAHNQYYSQHPEIAKEIKMAGDSDWANVKKLFKGKMNVLKGQSNAENYFCNEIFGSRYWDIARTVDEQMVCTGIADCIGQMSLGRYGGGHGSKYNKNTFLTARRTYNECIANVRSMMKYVNRAKIEKYFPALLAVVEKMSIL